MQLTLWFWPRILAFVALHTSVARLILWLRFDGRLNARPTPRETVPGCRHARAIDAKQVYSQQFRASEVRAWSTYSVVGPHWGRPD
jgi:hypothetical protein